MHYDLSAQFIRYESLNRRRIAAAVYEEAPKHSEPGFGRQALDEKSSLCAHKSNQSDDAAPLRGISWPATSFKYI